MEIGQLERQQGLTGFTDLHRDQELRASLS